MAVPSPGGAAEQRSIDEVYGEDLLTEAQRCMLAYYIKLNVTNKEILSYIAKVCS
jgi:hypothetical protein